MDYKRLPYGVADYTWIKSQNRYCADKTMFIPKMEEAGDFLYLIRQGSDRPADYRHEALV